MSSEQTTQETVPVEKTETSTEPVKTEPTTETKPEVTTTTTTTTSSWKESISEQYRNDPNIEKFTEIDALAKSYINACNKILNFEKNSNMQEGVSEISISNIKGI